MDTHRETHMNTHKEEWPLASQGVRLQEKERKTNFTDTLILESCVKIPFCCSSHPACSILLQQPWPTNTDCTPQMTKEKSTIKFTERQGKQWAFEVLLPDRDSMFMFTALSVVVICVSRYATRRRHPFAHPSQDSQTQEQWILTPFWKLCLPGHWPHLSLDQG